MIRNLAITALFFSSFLQAATIAIIDTGFDLDHDFLSPKVLKQETDEEAIRGWQFHDNSHLKKAVIEDQSSVQEVLLFRSLKAKGHREGLSLEEFDWFKKKSADKAFMELVRKFKKHSHGTFVAGIALREGENINIFPIRGLNISNPVVAVEDSSTQNKAPLLSKNPEMRFKEETRNSLDRVSKKFSKICYYVSLKKIEVVNASYGITYKHMLTKLRESYREITGKEIDDQRLQREVDAYFEELYRRGHKTVKRYPHILFVFSAGNSGLSNDRYHHYPSRIREPNTISVAAMNAEFLASFSNYGKTAVDIGAPGTAILSHVPKVYAQGEADLMSPASGTSMAAPYIANLAAQILNANPRLTPPQVKQIIMETGDVKVHLKNQLSSSAMVDNQKALKAAMLSTDMELSEAINLAKLNLIPMEDKISMSFSPVTTPEKLKEKVLETLPRAQPKLEADDEPMLFEDNGPAPTKGRSSSPKDLKKEQPDNSDLPSSTPPTEKPTPSDPAPSSQSAEQSPTPSVEPPASSSPVPPKPDQTPDPGPSPSSP